MSDGIEKARMRRTIAGHFHLEGRNAILARKDLRACVLDVCSSVPQTLHVKVKIDVSDRTHMISVHEVDVVRSNDCYKKQGEAELVLR